MRVIRSAEYRRMRWKNGQGETAEIAVAPAGAALERFDWRISMARIEAPGPFSGFAGIDRTLTVLSGEGLRLQLDGCSALELTPRSAPFSFAGDARASATLLGGTVTDLNVMTRRGVHWHRVRRVEGTAHAASDAEFVALFCIHGPARVVATAGAAELGSLDTLLLDGPAADMRIAAAVGGALLLVEIGRA